MSITIAFRNSYKVSAKDNKNIRTFIKAIINKDYIYQIIYNGERHIIISYDKYDIDLLIDCFQDTLYFYDFLNVNNIVCKYDGNYNILYRG